MIWDYLYEFEKRAIRLEIFVSTLNMEKDVFVIDKF